MEGIKEAIAFITGLAVKAEDPKTVNINGKTSGSGIYDLCAAYSRRRPEVLALAYCSDDKRLEAAEEKGLRRQNERLRQYNIAEIFPGRHVDDHRFQQSERPRFYSGPLHHRRRARPLGVQRRN